MFVEDALDGYGNGKFRHSHHTNVIFITKGLPSPRAMLAHLLHDLLHPGTRVGMTSLGLGWRTEETVPGRAVHKVNRHLESKEKLRERFDYFSNLKNQFC